MASSLSSLNAAKIKPFDAVLLYLRVMPGITLNHLCLPHFLRFSSRAECPLQHWQARCQVVDWIIWDSKKMMNKRMNGWPFDSYTSNAACPTLSLLIRTHFPQKHSGCSAAPFREQVSLGSSRGQKVYKQLLGRVPPMPEGRRCPVRTQPGSLFTSPELFQILVYFLEKERQMFLPFVTFRCLTKY